MRLINEGCDHLNFETITSLLGLGSIILMIMTTIFEHVEKKQMVRFERRTAEKEDRYRSILATMLVLLDDNNFIHISLTEKFDSITQGMNTEERSKFFFDELKAYYVFSHLYASDEVLENFKKFLHTPSQLNYENVAKAMRKDLWK